MEKLTKQIEQLSEIGKILRGEISEIVIHGDSFEEPIKPRADLDSKIACFLLAEAGVKYNKVTFVEKGSFISGSFNIDTGGESGVLIKKEEDGTITIFADHHLTEKSLKSNDNNPDSVKLQKKSKIKETIIHIEKGEKTSSAELIYKLLIKENLLEKSDYLDNLVNFVNDIDNENYPFNKEFFLGGWSQSLYSLYKKLSFETINNIFKEKRKVEKPFTDKEIETLSFKTNDGKIKPLKKICEEQQKLVEANAKAIKEAKELMFENRVKNFGGAELRDILINHLKTIKNKKDNSITINKITLGWAAIRALGFTSYIILNEEKGGFFITSKNELDETFKKISKEFPDAEHIRKTMIMQKPNGKKFDLWYFLDTLNLLR